MSTPNQYEFTAPEVSAASEHRRVRLTRIGILSAAIFSGAITAATTLVVVLPLLIGWLTSGVQVAEGLGSGVFIVLAPVMIGMLGFIGGAISALIYNIIAGMTGGLEMEFGPDA